MKAYIWKHPYFGTYCGYVDRSHVKQDLSNLDVHGGVTYEDELLVGFDCNHSYDLPDPNTHYFAYHKATANFPEATFKDIEFVKMECEKLAKQVNDVHCGILSCMVV